MSRKLYVGYTTDLRRRLKEHQNNLGHWTKNRGPWQLIYCEVYCNVTDARKRENFLKSGRGREIILKQLENTLGADSQVELVEK